MNEFRGFLESYFVEVNRLFAIVYSNWDADSKNPEKLFAKNHKKFDNVIITGGKLYDQAVNSDIKRYKKNRTLRTGQGEDHISGCLLDYDYIKNYYRLIAVDLSKQKELYSVSKEFGEMKFVVKLKNVVSISSDGPKFVFILTIFDNK